MGKESFIRGLIRAVGDDAAMDLGRIVGQPAKFRKLPPHLQLAAIRGETAPFLQQAGQGAGLDPRVSERIGMARYRPTPIGGGLSLHSEPVEMKPVLLPSGDGYGGGLAALAAAAAAGIAGMDAVMPEDEEEGSENQMLAAELQRAAETPPLGDMDGTGATTADLAAETTPPPVIEAIPTEEEIRDAKILQELEQVLGPEDFRALQYYMQGMPLRDAVFKLMDATPLGTP